MLADVKATFADRLDLHARIDMAVSPSSTARVAVVPLRCHRERITGVLDAALADPFGDAGWQKQFRGRLLAKDALVKYADTFEYVGTHNSLVEFPVPFRVPKGVVRPEDHEIMECSSVRDSYDHLRTCQLHVFVAGSVADALEGPVPSPYPSVVVVDVPGGVPGAAQVEGKTQTDADGGKVILVSSKTAIDGNDALAASPSHVTEYLERREASNIEAVERALFQTRPALNQQLLETVVRSCEQAIAPGGEYSARAREEQLARDTARIREARTRWAADAHTELQTQLLPAFDRLRFHTLAWWKLYWRADDVGDVAESAVRAAFLPGAQQQFAYVTGQIDASAERDYGAAVPSSPASDAIASARDATATLIATQLHNGAAKLLAATVFGVQLPSLVLPLLGVWFYGYTLWSMGSLIALGAVLGLRALQRGWLKLTDAAALTVGESARTALAASERRIWDRYERTVLREQSLVDKKVALLAELKTALRTSSP